MAGAVSRALAKAPLNLLLLFIGVLWLMPTLGLFLDSLLAPDADRHDRLVEDLHRAEPGHVRELRRTCSTTTRSRARSAPR